jgi:ATP-dependent Clp protease ATP-binding subunit ClpA
MFERFTDRARNVVVLAQEEARMLNHDHIGTEHILLGLVREGEGVAASALHALGISLAAVRQEVEKVIGRGQQPPPGHIPFSPRAKKVLELSLREGRQLGHDYIGTEHILLGLIREGEGVAAQVLVKLGADLNRVRQQVIQLLHGERLWQEPETTGPRAGPAGRGERRLHSELHAIELRLSAVEQRVGIGPDSSDLDRQIAQVRRDKESAIDAQSFGPAARLRDKEKQLITEKAARQEEWTAMHANLPSLAGQLDQLSDEVERLRSLLRQQGAEPQEGEPQEGEPQEGAQ